MRNSVTSFKRIFLLTVLLVLPQFLSGTTNAQLQESWLDTLWDYRRLVTITNPCGEEVSDYQVKVTLDSSFDFSRTQSEGSDIRITADDGVTLLPFWIETWDPNNQTAAIWVKIPTMPLGGTSLYLYYGNSAATSLSNGADTFTVYDGFEGNDVGSIPVAPGANAGSWSKYAGNPVIPNGFGSTFYDTDTGVYHNFVSYGTILHYTSTDGINWTADSANNPVLTPTQPWEGSNVGVPMAWKEDGTWYMLYRGGSPQRIGLATSPDGVIWTKSGANPVLSGDPGEWDDNTLDPWGVIKVDDTYYMWYNTIGTVPGLGRCTGLATSTNLTDWTKDINNPIFSGGRFCAFPFRYDGEYYLLIPHYTSGSDYSQIELYRDTNPTFYPGEREYLGVAIDYGPTDWDDHDQDTPAVLTDTIYRDSFAASNNQLWVYYAGEGGSGSWSTGMCIEENIDAAIAGIQPTAAFSWTASGSVTVVDDPVHQGIRSVRLRDTSSSGGVTLTADLSQHTTGVVSAWMRRSSTSVGDYDIYLYGEQLSCVAGLGRDGDFHYWNGTFQPTGVTWTENTWYLITIAFDTATNLYDFVVYDEDMTELVHVEGIAFGRSSTFINSAQLYTSTGFLEDGFADDFYLRQWCGADGVALLGDEEEQPISEELTITIVNPTAYEVGTLLLPPDYTPCYIDRAQWFTYAPDYYVGLPHIITANNDRRNTADDFMTINVNKPVTLYVCYSENAATGPDWLEDNFSPTGEQISRLYQTFNVWQSSEPLTGNITLGANMASGALAMPGTSIGMYVVIIEEVTGPVAPQITSTPITAAMTGALYIYDVQATDANVADMLTFSLDDAPAGMTIDPDTGLIEWTPEGSQLGNNDIIVRVTDSDALYDTQEYTISVSAASGLPFNLTPLDSAPGDRRWLDRADQEYSALYQTTYNYDQATAEVSFTVAGNVLQGTIQATNLKPNFTYQIKLVGEPDSAPFANELIGLAGRWWYDEWDDGWTSVGNLNEKGDCSSPSPNDSAYFSMRDVPDPLSPTGLRYRFTGYWVFDYLNTDEYGDALIDFTTDSSYHVCWKTSQSYQHSSDDGPVKSTSFDADLSTAYDDSGDDDYPLQTVDIFGEWERLPVGGIFLDPGDYRCQFILTEESFHGSGPPSSPIGNWAPAMGADIEFIILIEPPSIISAPPTDAMVGEPYTYGVEGTSPSTLTYFLDLAPGNMSIDSVTGIIEWTPDDTQVGDTRVIVTVEDESGLFKTQCYIITVEDAPVNDPPFITTTPITTATADSLYSYDVDATDLNGGDILTFSLDTAPNGMNIDPDTGLIEWTPSGAQLGDHGVMVRVTDSGNLFDLQDFTITVETDYDSLFDLGWNYRRLVDISNPCVEEVTGYQVKVTLDSTFDFSRAQADGSDVRVTADDGVTLLPFWVETWDPVNQVAALWVNIPLIPLGGTSIYLYYGNSSAAPLSNGDDTFTVYDGFEGNDVGGVPVAPGVNAGSWSKYAGNPVIPNGFGSTFYDNDTGIYHNFVSYGTILHYTSPDGINWTADTANNPVLTPTQPWEGSNVGVPMAWKEDGTWYMLYRGGSPDRIGLATSPDAVTWTKSGANPVLSGDPGAWDDRDLDPWGVIKVGDTYYLWYNTIGGVPGLGRCTGLATSTNLTDWTKDINNPIFSGGRFCAFPFSYNGEHYLLIPHYTSGTDYSQIELYRDTNPTFYPDEREYLGVAINYGPTDWDDHDQDTPAVLTDTIYRDTYAASNNQLWVYYAGEGGDGSWQTGMTIEEDIEAAIAGVQPSTSFSWGISGDDVTVVDDPVRQGTRSVRQRDTSSGSVTLTGNFSSQTSGALAAWMRRSSTSNGDYDIYLYGEQLSCVAGLGRDGGFHYWNGTFQPTGIPWDPDTWYLVTIAFDAGTNLYDFVVSDETMTELVRVEGIAFGRVSTQISSAVLYTSGGFIEDGVADDFYLRQWCGADGVAMVGDEEGQPVIEELIISIVSPSAYEIGTLLLPPDYTACYIDRAQWFIDAPDYYVELPFIRTANADRRNTATNFLTFNVNMPVTVYVCYSENAESGPDWLENNFTPTGEQISRLYHTFDIWQSNDSLTGTITLGANMASGAIAMPGTSLGMYLVIIEKQ